MTIDLANRPPAAPHAVSTLQMQLTIGAVQRALGGISRTRVIQLDPVLQPRREGPLGTRVYDPDRLAFVAGYRAVSR